MNAMLAGLILVGACLAGLSPAPAVAQSPESAATQCKDLLTPLEELAIVGENFRGPEFSEPSPDFTSCDWQGQGANFSFTFIGPEGMKANYQTAEEAFDMDLVAVENDQRKREMLPDIGLKAAQVMLDSDSSLIEVQRADGVVRMTFYKIDAGKVIALARAVASP